MCLQPSESHTCHACIHTWLKNDGKKKKSVILQADSLKTELGSRYMFLNALNLPSKFNSSIFLPFESLGWARFCFNVHSCENAIRYTWFFYVIYLYLTKNMDIVPSRESNPFNFCNLIWVKYVIFQLTKFFWPNSRRISNTFNLLCALL